MKKRFAALAAALALALTGCGGAGTLKSMEWAIEPAYEFEAVEPVADPDSTTPPTVARKPGEAGYYLVRTGEGWGVLDVRTGNTAAEGAFEEPPSRCGLGHLFDPGSASLQWEDKAAYDRFNDELEALGTSYRLEVGHGGGTDYFLADETGAVTAVGVSENGFNVRPVAEVEGLPGLIPVRRGAVVPTDDGWEKIVWDEGERFAAATSHGELLTDFVYENACMGTDEAIAVCKEGKWGYVDTAGKEIVPCEYEPFWGVSWGWNEETGEQQVDARGVYPAPFTQGCVVVKQNGQTGVLKADGSWLLKMGEAEDAAPAFGGLLWVKTEGKWGAVKLPG